jgi:subtilisin-like proprotein convertase family protein
MLVASVLAVAAYMVLSQTALAAVPTVVYSSGNVNVPIPASGTSGLMTDQVINVADTGNIYDVNVRLRLNHTYDADLEISLIAPDGTTIDLSSDNGNNWDNFGSGATDCSGTRTVLDSDAALALVSYDPPWAGRYRPEGNLDGLRGHNINGNWTLRINDDAAGDTGALYCWQLVIGRDATAPTTPVQGGALNRAVQVSTSFKPAWSASDPESGVAYYYPTVWTRPYTSATFTAVSALGSVRATSKTYAGAAGNTYCFTTYARNFVFLYSPESAYKCTAVPVNNTSLIHSAGWTQKTGLGYYKNTYSQAKTQGSSLTLNAIVGDRVGIVATKCPGCGVIDVFIDTGGGPVFLKRFNLNATTTLKKRVLLVPAFAVPNTTGNLTVVVASSGKPVRIEGVGVLNHE